MIFTTTATYDGKVLVLDEPISLLPNTRVRITVELMEECRKPRTSFLDTARSAHLQGPPDWATNLDEYLYGSRTHSD